MNVSARFRCDGCSTIQTSDRSGAWSGDASEGAAFLNTALGTGRRIEATAPGSRITKIEVRYQSHDRRRSAEHAVSKTVQTAKGKKTPAFELFEQGGITRHWDAPLRRCANPPQHN